jgi:hypothetical protein
MLLVDYLLSMHVFAVWRPSLSHLLLPGVCFDCSICSPAPPPGGPPPAPPPPPPTPPPHTQAGTLTVAAARRGLVARSLLGRAGDLYELRQVERAAAYAAWAARLAPQLGRAHYQVGCRGCVCGGGGEGAGGKGRNGWGGGGEGWDGGRDGMGWEGGRGRGSWSLLPIGRPHV